MSLAKTNRNRPSDGKYAVGPFNLTEQQIANVFNMNVVESITASRQLLAEDGGKKFTLDAAAGLTVTLPSVSNAGAGWNCEIIVGTNCTSNSYIITENTAEDTDVLISKIIELEVDTSDDGPSSQGHTTITLGNATDTVGDSFKIYCDGTNYHVNGITKLDAGAALA